MFNGSRTRDPDGSFIGHEFADGIQEAGLLPVGEGAIRTATVIGAGTVYRLGSQEAGPAQGILSVRHPAGEGGRGARQGRRQGRSYPSAGRRRRRVEGRSGCRC